MHCDKQSMLLRTDSIVNFTVNAHSVRAILRVSAQFSDIRKRQSNDSTTTTDDIQPANETVVINIQKNMII